MGGRRLHSQRDMGSISPDNLQDDDLHLLAPRNDHEHFFLGIYKHDDHQHFDVSYHQQYNKLLHLNSFVLHLIVYVHCHEHIHGVESESKQHDIFVWGWDSRVSSSAPGRLGIHNNDCCAVSLHKAKREEENQIEGRPSSQR